MCHNQTEKRPVDPILQPFLQAATSLDEERALEAIIQQVEPVIRGVIRRKLLLFEDNVSFGRQRAATKPQSKALDESGSVISHANTNRLTPAPAELDGNTDEDAE